MYNANNTKKLTSLTLMAIMVAGGLTFAVPGMMPEVVAENQHLFVSAYYPGNEYKEYYFGGAAVVEVVVRDPDINSTELGIPGAPRVEVNGDKLPMVQGADGAWYAYVADDAKVTVADALGTDYGLEYGSTCTSGASGTAVTATGIDDTTIFDDVEAVWVSQTDCSAPASATDTTAGTHILKSPQGINLVGGTDGNVGITADAVAWPFISVYNFDNVSAEFVYYKSTGSETQYVKYSSGKDSAHYATTDRTEYPPSAQIYLELMAPGLNLDPTSVDNWTFDVGSETDANSTTACYYDKYTDPDSAASRTEIPTTMGLKDTCTLLITFGGSSETILDIQDNDDSVQEADHLTFLETAPSSGYFTIEDDDNDSQLIVKSDAKRNTSATISYDDSPFSIVVKNFTASLEFLEEGVGEEWNSGEELEILMTDEDHNLQAHDDEDFKFSEEDHVYPTIHVGDPLLLTGSVVVNLAAGGSDSASVDGSSGVGYIGSAAAEGGDLDAGSTLTTGLVINTGIDVKDFTNMASALDSDSDSELSDEDTNAHSTAANGTQHRGAMIMNWDVSGLIATSTNVDIVIQDQDGGGLLGTIDAQSQSSSYDITELFTGSGTADISDFDDDQVYVNFYFEDHSSTPNTSLTGKTAFYIDFFSFHSNGINNAVYRCQCEETGDGSGQYSGVVEYYMINQNEGDAYADWPSRTHLSDELVMIMTGDLTGVDAPRIQVSDTDGDGVSTPQADQVDALTHSGTASFDADSYKIADTVTVTITDMDLNTDSELIEVYKVDDDGGTDGTGSADR
ncbi:MAG: hypothetical protein VX209_00385, partial [Thermoproteota archaeon]|nr:hypothetical protein [Thermoproteota archaeon]